jgi:elongation factor Ts
MEITAKMVSELREQTGAGMMECKKALIEAGGDVEKARDLLRTKGKAGAEKRSGRSAADGVVGAALTENGAALVELNCETDFVARNEEFLALARALTEAALHTQVNTPEELLQQNEAVRHQLEDALAKLRENIVFRRFIRYEAGPDSVLATYVHTVSNKIGVLVELLGSPMREEHKALARNIAMHIAANKPEYLRREEVPAESVEREREVLAELTRNEGKPEAAIPKIVEGRLGKYFERVCLLEQPYVRDPSKKISQLLEETGVEARRFVLFVVGQ